MVNSESMGSTGDGKQPKDYITQLNSGVAGGGISVDTHSPSPVTASSVRLREMDYDANESAADVTSAECANPADSLPEAAVTRSIDEENFRLTNTVTSQTDSEVSSLYCSVPLNKVQDVLSSYSADSPAATKKLLPRRLLCLYCDRTFVTSNLRSKHVERCHSVKQARRSSSRFQSRCPTACSFCRKLNNTDHDLNDLFRHLVEKHSNKYFACVPCEERFVFKTHLEEHNLHNHEPFKDESSACNGAIPSQDYPTEDATEVNTVKTKHKTRIKKESSEFDEEEANRPNLRMSVRKELRKKKVGVKSTKTGVKRNTRLQTKVTNAQTKPTAAKRRTKTRNEKSNKEESSEKSSTSVNPYPTFDAYFRVKKITDHSIDNLKISSLTFDDVFDKAFYTRIKCNIQENLQNHIDGKLFKNEESESRISNFEKNQELNSSPAENFGCDISLNAATPVVSLLSSQLGEDLESQIEYGAKASKKKPPPKKDEVHYKYFTRRKYQASILENKENRDLSKLDMWTQLVVKDRQQKIINDNKSEKEKIEYTKGIEYRTKMQNLELNRILDRRGPFEDLKEEANKKAAIEKYNNRLGENISCEAISDVTSILNDLIDRTFDLAESTIKTEVDEKTAEQIKLQLSDRDCELPFYLSLRRNSSLVDQPDIDKSDRITLICSSQETENFEESAAPRDKNTLVELTGEWTRTRIYICAACGVKVPNIKQLIDHKSVYHQNVWVQHYEFVGNQSVLYRHLSIPGLGKVGLVEQCPMSKLWKRSDARLCTKCSKMCNTLGELHRHMLECGEDWSWMLARKKLKYRPFGAKSRRKRRGLVKRIIHKEKSGDEVRQKRKYNIKKYDGPRPKPSDAETIQRMLANLPAKRATRKLISLKDGFPKQIRRKPQRQSKPSNSTKNVAVKKKASVSSLSNQTLKGNKPRKKGRKCNSMILRKSVRNINKVFGSKILDTNSTLIVKRKIKTVLHHQRITRARKCLVDEQQEEKMDEDMPPKKKGLINKMKMLTRAVRKTVLKKDDSNRNDNNSDNSTSVNSSANTIKLRNTRNLKKGDSLDDTIQDIMDSIGSKDGNKPEVSEQSAETDEEFDSKTETTTKKPRLVKKESVSAKLVRTFSLRKLRKKTTMTEDDKLKTQSNPELNMKTEKVKNGKRKSTLDSFRNKIKKIKLKEKSITHIAQVDGSSQISDEILPFLEKININSDENQDKNEPDFGENLDEDPLGDINPMCDEIIAPIVLHEETNEPLTSMNGENNIPDQYLETIQYERATTPVSSQMNEDAAEESTTANPCVIATSSEIEEVADTVAIESPLLQPSDEIKKESVDHENSVDPQDCNTSETPIDLKICSSAKINKNKKRAKGLNDCIAMLTSKLKQKVDDQPIATDTPTESICSETCSAPIVEKEILQKPVDTKQDDKPENTKAGNKSEKKDQQQHYMFTQNQFIDQQALLEINRKIFDWENFEKQRQEYFNLQAKLLAEQQQLFLQQLQKQIPTNHQYNYIPNIPRETGFLLNNIMMNNQTECVQKLTHINQMDDLSKFMSTMSRNNRFKEVDVNVDLLKYFGSIDNCVVKLEKLKNKNEGRKKANSKATSARRYSNKRKENIEVMNDLKQQEPINKIVRPGEVDLNPAFLEGEESKQKKLDAFKESDIVIDLKIKKIVDIPHQTVSKPPDMQTKNESIPKPPKVIEVSQMRSAGFGLNQEIHEAIDLKMKKNAEIERQTNLLEQLSKNGVSIALFPCNQNSVKKCAGFPGNNEVMDLKITRKDDNKTLSVGLAEGNHKINNRDVFGHSHSLINLKIDGVMKNNVNTTVPYNNMHPTTAHGFEKYGSISDSTSVKNVLMKPFANSVESTFVPVSLVPDQIRQLHDICAKSSAIADPTPLKKYERKKRNTKSSKHKLDIVHHEQISQQSKLPVIETLQQNNEVIDLKINKSASVKAGEIKSLSDLKPIIPEFHQMDLKLFNTLHATHVNGSKTNIKTDKNRQIAEAAESQIHTGVKKDDKCGLIGQSVTKEKKKFILKPPQFIATSLEKIPVIENLVLPKVPTIAESLSFSVPQNLFAQDKGIQEITKKKDGARSKNFDSIENKIKSFLLEEREPDVMEEKLVERTCVRVPNLKACENLIQQLNDKEILSFAKPIDDKQSKICTKSDTDSEDDIPLANLLRESKKKDTCNQTMFVESSPNQDPPVMKKVMEQTDAEKTSSENQKQSETVQDRIYSPIVEEKEALVVTENETYVTKLVDDRSALLENDNSLQNNLQPILEPSIPTTENCLPIIEKEFPSPTPDDFSYLPTIENVENLMSTLDKEDLPISQNIICPPNLNEETPLPVQPNSISLPISDVPTNSLAVERDACLPPVEKESSTPILEIDHKLPILPKNMCLSEFPMELADNTIIAPLGQSSLENQAYTEIAAASSEFGQDATMLNALLIAIDSKNKKVRVKKKTTSDDKKDEPKKKPARRSKGTPLIDESEIDPLNKAARKIRISCQIFQKSCKIALDKNMIDQPEEEEEEDRVLTQLPTVTPMIETSLPDVFIKEELSTELVLPIENPIQLLQNIKEELPEIEEGEPVQTEGFPLALLDLPESIPGLSAEDLELEIRRRIKLSNLQLKRENVEDSQVMPATIDTTIIYNVDSPEMPYTIEDNVMPTEYEHVLCDIPGTTASNTGIDVIIGSVPFVNGTTNVIDAPGKAIPNLYATDHIFTLHNNFILNSETPGGLSNHYNCNYDENKVPEPLINDSNDPTMDVPNDVNVNPNCNNVVDDTKTSTAAAIIDIPKENASPSTADLKTTAQAACLINAVITADEGNITEIDFDVEHEKEGDLPTETANTPNIEVLEEQKQLAKDIECKSKKLKKKHEEPTTDIPTYGEFQVSTGGINKITLSRKKLPAKSESNDGFTEGGQNNANLDIYEVKKVKRSHRKSISSKEKKKKKLDVPINERNFENGKDTFNTNSDRISTAFDDIYLDNVEFEVQNEEIGRRLKINKKKIKDVLADVVVEDITEPSPIPDFGLEDSRSSSFERNNKEIGKKLKIGKKKAKDGQETPVLETFVNTSSLTVATIETPVLSTEETRSSDQNRNEELIKKLKITKKKVKDSVDVVETPILSTFEGIIGKNEDINQKLKLNENKVIDIPIAPTAEVVTDSAPHLNFRMETSIASAFEEITNENRNDEANKKVKINKKCKTTLVVPILESITDTFITPSQDVEDPMTSNFNVVHNEESKNEEIMKKSRMAKRKIRENSIVPILEAVSDTPIIPNFEVDTPAPEILEAVTDNKNKSEILNLTTDEEHEDYDNLPKDMEIEEFQVDIPIIETQFKSTFNTSIPNAIINNSMNETTIKFTMSTKEASVLTESNKEPLDSFEFEVQDLLGPSLNGEGKTELERRDKNMQPEASKLEFINTVTDSKLDDECLDNFSLKNFYDENLTVKQNFTSNLTIINSGFDCFSTTMQNDALMSGFDEIVSGNVSKNLLEKSTPTKKNKKTKNSKLNAETSVNIEESQMETVEEVADIIATHTTGILGDQLSCSNSQTEAKVNVDMSLPDDLQEICVNAISTSMNENENMTASKKNKKNPKTKLSISNSPFITPPNDVSTINSDMIDSAKISLISTSTPQSATSKKNKRTKATKQTMPQQIEPSPFDIMCDELQALCDAPLELTSLNQDQTQAPQSDSKEIEAIDDDLDFLSASPSSFCNNIKTSCDAKIDELLREINFSPKPSKKSKKSKNSKKPKETPDNSKIDIKIVDDKHCEIESEINKADESVDLDQSENISSVDVSNEISLPHNESLEDIEKLATSILENSNEEIPTTAVLVKPKSKSKSKKKSKAKQMKIPTVENTEAYCDICDKIFARNENLVKHKRTLTHIAKLSEIEALQAQVRVQENKESLEPPEEEQKIYKMDININDILNNAEKHSPDQQDINNEISSKMHISSPFILKTNSDTLKLADIINDVLNKPVENEKPSSYADSHLSQTSSSVTQGETKRYKSLGERKSFESDLKTTYPFNNMPVTSDTIPKLPNTDSILKQQISILENIIETEGPFGYIDDITVSSNKSIVEPLPKSPSELSIMSESKHDDSNQLTFSHSASAGDALAKSNIGSDTFIKPTQYEEISNDSSSIKNQFDDQRSRKVLNRDEELFLECCSLLKSSSEVSGYSKKSAKTVHVFNNFEMKQSDEPEWLEKKNFTKSQEYRHELFSNSCPNTPLGDGYGEDYSNTNSNTIATDWSTKQREQQQENPVFEDISLDSKGSTNSKLDSEQYKQTKRTFGDFQLFNLDHQKNADIKEASQANEDKTDEKEVDEEFKKKMVSRFGGLMAKALKASMQAVKKNKYKKKQEGEINQTSITDYTVPINTTAKVDIDANDSKKMLTKGAMKVFEGLKVSIRTDDLNIKELLNGSHSNKKQNEEPNPEPTDLLQPKESEVIKEDIKISKPNNIRNFGNRLGLKVTKKKYTIAKPLSNDVPSATRPPKIEEDSKKNHDVYDFEETQDNVDVFSTKLTNIKEFRNQIAEKKTELCPVKAPTPVEGVEESDSDDRRDILDSFSYEAQSLSGISTGSLSSLKKPKKKNITKKKCMIMGRIFKNAFKSKIEEDIRDIPSVENAKLVEDYVMHLPSVEEKRAKLSEQEMDLLFDKLLEEKVAKEETKKPIEEPPVTPNPVSVEKPPVVKGKSKNPPKRKRQRYNSESTDDEFSLSKNKKRYSKKKQKNVDNAINLEQELKECIGVASRKSQRKCTSGKQNVLVEFWSSDDSNFEAFLRETAAENSKGNDNLKDTEEIAKVVAPTVISEDVEVPSLPQPALTSDELPKDAIKRPTHKNEIDNQKITVVNPVINKSDKAPTPKQTKKKSSIAKHRGKIEDVEEKKIKSGRGLSETLAANRRKRAASNTLYYWSSSSEDESQDLIEVKPVRDEIDEDEDRPMQHGWIVGDSPKKLVTMLAQAKGKKVDTDSVKEQGKKRTTM